MGRLLDHGSYIGAGGSGGIFGLNFLDSKSQAVELEIVGGYPCVATYTDLTATIPGVKAGDVLLLCLSSDGVGPTYITDWVELYGLSSSAHGQIFSKTITSAGTEDFVLSVATASTYVAWMSGVILHVRGIDLSSRNQVGFSQSAKSSFYFFELPASAKPRLVVAFGALDDDRVSTQSDQSFTGYGSYGAGVSHSVGSSAHVWAKITDGSTEGPFYASMNGGNDYYTSIIMGLDKAA